MTRDVANDVLAMIEKRRAAGLICAPTTLAFRHGTGRPGTPMEGELRMSSLCADYPPEWPAMNRKMRRYASRDGLARCGCCGDWVPSHQIQIAHLGWNPKDLRMGWLMPLCADCHRGWDQPQQDSGAALTAAGEGTLPWSRYCERVTYIRDEVRQHGLIRLAPAALDLAVAASVQDSPCRRAELADRLGMWFPMVVKALRESPATELEDVLDAALVRLGMRWIDETEVSFVAQERGWVVSRIGRLHCDPDIDYTPTSRWTNPRYLRSA